MNQVTPGLIQSILELVQSGAPRTMLDLIWTIVLNPEVVLAAHARGGSGDGPPKWLKTLKYRSSWRTHYFQGPLTCAAFCLANWLNDGGRHRTPTKLKYGDNPVSRALAQVRELQDQFGWGELVSMLDLKVFTDTFSKYRLTLIRPDKATPEASFVKVYTGEDYVGGSRDCDCIMINFDDHWSLTCSIDEFISHLKNGGAYRYCGVCELVRKYNSAQRRVWPCHETGVSEKNSNIKKACTIALCEGMVHSATSHCPYYKCKTCHMGVKKPTPNTIPHRCLVLPDNIEAQHPHNKYWNEDAQDYDFCTDQEGDGSVPAFFAYDMETMTVEDQIEPDQTLILQHPDPDDNFGIDLDDLEDLQTAYMTELAKTTPNLDAYNLTGTVKRLVPNLVIITNIYSGNKIPERLGDEPYNPKLVKFEGLDCVTQMIHYLRSYNKGNCYAFAHNGSGFDGKFIFDAVNKINGLQQEPILRGKNFLSLKVKLGKKGNTTYFYDSMLHLPGSLARLIDGFFKNSPDPNLKGGKGHFPHGFNTPENQNYVGPIPAIEHFSPDQLPMGSGKDKWTASTSFQDWYDGEADTVWDFQKEYLKYCNMDVYGLAALLKVYMAISIPKGGIPLMKTTAPSFVHQLYLQRVVKGLVLPEIGVKALEKQILRDENISKAALKKKVKHLKAQNTRLYLAEIEKRSKTGWPRLGSTEYNFVRRSLRGGRTVTTDSYMELTDAERDQGIRILYQDVTSLYPAEQMTQKFPCGPPTIHFYTWGFKPCWHCQNRMDESGEFIMECDCPLVALVTDGVKGRKKGYEGESITQIDCREDPQPTADSFINDEEMFGYVCCDLTPPTNLFHPVIQIKKAIFENGVVIGEKCQNNLLPEDHKKLYLDTPTLKYALESGYRLDFVYRFDKYLKGEPLWKDCAMDFYTDKERTSGPKPSTTSKGVWCDSFRKEFGTEPDNERQAYIDLYNHIVPGLGDTLLESMDTLEWSKQPAQRQVYKVFNNCGWGKHAQRPVMSKTSMFHVADQYSEMVTMFQNLTNNLMDLRGCLVYDNGKRLMFTTLAKNASPDHHKTYLPAGAMVPAYGRLTLLRGLSLCGERVAMCDTDSIVYKTSLDPTKNIPISGLLGRYKEEDCSEEIIREFVGFGPKCYSIMTEKIEPQRKPNGTIVMEPNEYIKLKGIKQTVQNQNINHAYMKAEMLNHLATGEIRSLTTGKWGMDTNLCNNGQVTVVSADSYKDFKLMGEKELKGKRKTLPNGHQSSKIYPFGFIHS